MTSIKTISLFAGALLCGNALSAPPKTNLLSIGDPAPELKVSKWFKGGPVDSFQEGHVYVVEFWATWCPPCKTAIPHLSKLAQKYKDSVTVIGVNISDKASDQAIEEFLDSMKPEETQYHIARDNTDFMIKQWLSAAGQKTIPNAFVVDQKGKVVWIGNPMRGLDTALEQVVASSSDSTTSAQAKMPDQAYLLKIRSILQRRFDYTELGKQAEALAYLTGALDADPTLHHDLFIHRYRLLASLDEAQLIRELQFIADQNRPKDGIFAKGTFPNIQRTGTYTYLHELASTSYIQDASPQFYQLLEKELKAAAEQLQGTDNWVVQGYARSAYMAGDTKGAIEALKRLLTQIDPKSANAEHTIDTIQQDLWNYQRGCLAEGRRL